MDALERSGTRRRGPRVLVVDDEAMVARALARVLTRAGFVVVTAHGATEAVARCEECSFDVVVTDQSMPGVNGTELIAIIHRVFGVRRFVVCSGKDVPGPFVVPDVRVVGKPWRDEALLAAVAGRPAPDGSLHRACTEPRGMPGSW